VWYRMGKLMPSATILAKRDSSGVSSAVPVEGGWMELKSLTMFAGAGILLPQG
jgi:hypothetical protein